VHRPRPTVVSPSDTTGPAAATAADRTACKPAAISRAAAAAACTVRSSVVRRTLRAVRVAQPPSPNRVPRARIFARRRRRRRRESVASAYYYPDVRIITIMIVAAAAAAAAALLSFAVL